MSTNWVCRHERWEPVKVADEVVATICADCLIRMPATYSGAVEAVSVAEYADPVEYLPLGETDG